MSKLRRPVTVLHRPCSPNFSGTRFSVNFTSLTVGSLDGAWSTSAAAYCFATPIRHSRSQEDRPSEAAAHTYDCPPPTQSSAANNTEAVIHLLMRLPLDLRILTQHQLDE